MASVAARQTIQSRNTVCVRSQGKASAAVVAPVHAKTTKTTLSARVSSFTSTSVRMQRQASRSPARRSVLHCTAEEAAEIAVQYVEPADVDELVNGRGFTIVDIRSPEETDKGTKNSWQIIPLAAMTEEGPVLNPNFLGKIKETFPNSLSRIIVACDDGEFRSEVAFKNITEKMGYSQVKVIKGGLDEYLKVNPFTEKDLIKWKMSDADRAGPDTAQLANGVAMGQFMM